MFKKKCRGGYIPCLSSYFFITEKRLIAQKVNSFRRNYIYVNIFFWKLSKSAGAFSSVLLPALSLHSYLCAFQQAEPVSLETYSTGAVQGWRTHSSFKDGSIKIRTLNSDRNSKQKGFLLWKCKCTINNYHYRISLLRDLISSMNFYFRAASLPDTLSPSKQQMAHIHLCPSARHANDHKSTSN